jgi:hypothetical protein
MFKIPILIISYRRAEKLRRVIEELNQLGCEKIYVFNDFAKTAAEIDKNEETRELINTQIKAQVLKKKFANKNLGCRHGPETAINWFFEHEEMGIILEEDCLPSEDFFRFCEELLIKYKDESSILQINGTNLIAEYIQQKENSYYLSSVTSAWGWASWRRAWALYSLSVAKYGELKSAGKLGTIYSDKEIRKLRTSEIESVLYKNFDAWDFLWRFTVNLNGFALTPKFNLVQNIGFDEEATHTLTYDQKEVKEFEKIQWPLVHPPLKYDRRLDMLFYKKLYPNLFQSRRQTITKKIIALFKTIKS